MQCQKTICAKLNPLFKVERVSLKSPAVSAPPLGSIGD